MLHSYKHGTHHFNMLIILCLDRALTDYLLPYYSPPDVGVGNQAALVAGEKHRQSTVRNQAMVVHWLEANILPYFLPRKKFGSIYVAVMFVTYSKYAKKMARQTKSVSSLMAW